MVYSQNRTFLINKKEQTTDVYNNMDDSQKYYAQQKKQDTKVYILCDSIYVNPNQQNEHSEKIQKCGSF